MQRGYLAPEIPGGPLTAAKAGQADNEATRLFSALTELERLAEQALAVGHRVHERLFGPEPQTAGKDTRVPTATTGVLDQFTRSTLDVTEAVLRIGAILADIEKRLSA